MKFTAKTLRNTVLGALALVPSLALAGPITYDITDGSSGSFTASWLHAGTSAQSDGFYMNGNKASISGSLTIDWDTGAASGSISTDSSDTDFGLGSGNWTLTVIGGSVADIGEFNNGDSLLLSLDYLLTDGASHSSAGTFFFADTEFTGDVNSADENEIYLWGNNWFNENGISDKTDFVNGGGVALGIDLYGSAAVPEPSALLLLGLALSGLGLRRKQLAG